MHSVARSKKGISTLSLIILLLVSGIIGAILSYLWTVGYYIEIGHTIPEGVTTITITNVTFPIENSTYFDVAVLNPSYSNAAAKITSIALVTTTDGNEAINRVQANSIKPSVPYTLEKGETITFRCNQKWGEFAGQIIRVVVFLQNDSGATFPHETGNVKLIFIKTEIDTKVTIECFNVTVRNSVDSLIALNVSEILFDSIAIPSQNITVKDENASLPQQLQPNQTKTFTCNWNIKGVLGVISSSHTIAVKTLQGYSAMKTETLPAIVSLDISDVSFTALPDTSGLNVTISNHPGSPHFINVSRVTVKNGTQVFDNVTVTGVLHNSTVGGALPVMLVPGGNLTLQCMWNWESFKGRAVTITVYTTQGYSIFIYKTFPE